MKPRTPSWMSLLTRILWSMWSKALLKSKKQTLNPLSTSRFLRFSKIAVKIQNLQDKKTTPLWSKIVKITNYGIKYTSCQLKIFQNTNLKVKISKILMKFDPRVTWAKFDPSREHVFVYERLRSCHVLSMKIERKTHKKLS